MIILIYIGIGLVLGVYIVSQIGEHINKNINHNNLIKNMKKFEEEKIKSECCGYDLVGETDLCSKCKEHTGQ